MIKPIPFSIIWLILFLSTSYGYTQLPNITESIKMLNLPISALVSTITIILLNELKILKNDYNNKR